MYRQIVENHLRINPEFFKEHCTTIVNRLMAAHNEMVKGDAAGGASGTPPKMLLQDTIYGINQCIHLASSLAVLGGAGHLQEAVDFIRDKQLFPHLDPTTVLTIAVLNYVLRDYMGSQQAKATLAAEQAKATSTSPDIVDDILRRFDMVNWMIGPEAMRALGIQMSAPVAAKLEMEKKSSN